MGVLPAAPEHELYGEAYHVRRQAGGDRGCGNGETDRCWYSDCRGVLGPVFISCL